MPNRHPAVADQAHIKAKAASADKIYGFNAENLTDQAKPPIKRSTQQRKEPLMSRVTVSSARYFVSTDMFAIITEAIHLHSDNAQKFQSLRSVVEFAADKLQSHVFVDDHFQDFIKSVPLSGKAKIYLRVETSINERLAELKAKLEEACGIQVYDRTAIAYFLQLCIEKKLY